MIKRRRKPLLFQILFRIVLLFFLFLLILTILFVNGNFRAFQEDTQLFLLSLMSLTASIVIPASIFCGIAIIIFSIRTKTFRYLSNTIFLVISLSLSIVLLYLSRAVYLLSFGV